jgi:hypothetical protein
MAKELRQTKDLIQQLLQGNYAMEYTMMQVIISNISSLLKFKFCLTDNLMINKINTVWHDTPVSSPHDTGRSLDTTRRLVSGTFVLFQL